MSNIEFKVLRLGIHRGMTREEISEKIEVCAIKLFQRIEHLNALTSIHEKITVNMLVMAMMQEFVIVEEVELDNTTGEHKTTSLALMSTGLYWLTNKVHATVHLLISTRADDRLITFLQEIAKAKHCDIFNCEQRFYTGLPPTPAEENKVISYQFRLES